MAETTTTDPQRHLLTLIRDFASQKSQGERRVIGLKNRFEELKSELELANIELEESKRVKEIAEQEVKGFEVELTLLDDKIQALQARICLVQDEVSTFGSDVDYLKNEEICLRDEFINTMFELNNKIRRFQETISQNPQKENSIETAAEKGNKVGKKVVNEVDLSTLEDMLSHVVSQTAKEEKEYIAELDVQKQIQQEYVDIKRKVSLVEMVVKETKALQDLTRQTSELEQSCASIGEEFQKRCVCPSCHTDNMEVLSHVLQATDTS